MSATLRLTLSRVLVAGVIGGGAVLLTLNPSEGEAPVVKPVETARPNGQPMRTMKINKFDGKPIRIGQKRVVPEASPQEIETQKRIEAVEAGIIAFAAKLDSKLPATEEGERLRKLFRLPLEFVEFNIRENEKRSAMTYEREHGYERGLHKISGQMASFYYAFEEKDYTKSAAAFSTDPRTMLLSADYDPTNDADNLVLMHELMHVHYDTLTRLSVKGPEGWKAYHEIHSYELDGGTPNYNVIDEARAYSMELDALNVLLDGRLERAVRTGQGMSMSEIQQVLGATKPNQFGPINFVVGTLGFAYFTPGKKDNHGFTTLFLDRLAAAAQARGYNTVIPKADGSRLIPYR